MSSSITEMICYAGSYRNREGKLQMIPVIQLTRFSRNLLAITISQCSDRYFVSGLFLIFELNLKFFRRFLSPIDSIHTMQLPVRRDRES
jgi:hypothetical protein